MNIQTQAVQIIKLTSHFKDLKGALTPPPSLKHVKFYLAWRLTVVFFRAALAQDMHKIILADKKAFSQSMRVCQKFATYPEALKSLE